MKLIMTLLVRDEQDIIRENIEYHLSQGVDFIIATDNRSVDSTSSILKEFEEKDLLHYIYEPSDDYNQHAWVTRMARMAFEKYGADWVINNDADEFWWPLAGTLKSTFESIPPTYNLLNANRLNFVPVENSKSSFYHRMIYSENVSLNPLGRPLPPKVAHRGCNNIVVDQGNHSVHGLENPKAVDDLIEIFHYPCRTYEQLVNKIAKGGAAYERNTELPREVGATWRELYREYQRNDNLRGYFGEISHSDSKLRLAMNMGAIRKDTRLSDYFTQKGLDYCQNSEMLAYM